MKNKTKLLFVSNSAPDRIIHILDAFKNRDNLEIDVEHLWTNKKKIVFLPKYLIN